MWVLSVSIRICKIFLSKLKNFFASQVEKGCESRTTPVGHKAFLIAKSICLNCKFYLFKLQNLFASSVETGCESRTTPVGHKVFLIQKSIFLNHKINLSKLQNLFASQVETGCESRTTPVGHKVFLLGFDQPAPLIFSLLFGFPNSTKISANSELVTRYSCWGLARFVCTGLPVGLLLRIVFIWTQSTSLNDTKIYWVCQR